MDKAKIALIETEYKQNLREYLDEGLKELVKKLDENSRALNPVKIYSYIRNRNARGMNMRHFLQHKKTSVDLLE